MHPRTKRFLAAATAAASLAVAAPATGHAAAGTRMNACHVKPLGTHSELGQIVAIAGAYRGPADAREVHLTCVVLTNGGIVARVTDTLAGPVAALADVRGVPGGTVTSCYEIKVVHLDGRVTYNGTCS